jgi:hypothetical protein
VRPSIELWRSIFYVTSNNNSSGWYSISPTGRYGKFIEPGANKRHGWKEKFFFIKERYLWETIGGWGKPNEDVFRTIKNEGIRKAVEEDLRRWSQFDGCIKARDITPSRVLLMTSLYEHGCGIGSFLSPWSLSIACIYFSSERLSSYFCSLSYRPFSSLQFAILYRQAQER